jgi:hypothetical protein
LLYPALPLHRQRREYSVALLKCQVSLADIRSFCYAP